MRLFPITFLHLDSFFYPFLKLLMPRQRPMDNMSMGVGSPQEDDFALCAYGAPTPYRRIAFPNQPSREHLNLKLSDADHEVQEKLHGAMNYFLKALTVRYDSQLVLKSPPHTGRLEQLVEWFSGGEVCAYGAASAQVGAFHDEALETLGFTSGFSDSKIR